MTEVGGKCWNLKDWLSRDLKEWSNSMNEWLGSKTVHTSRVQKAVKHLFKALVWTSANVLKLIYCSIHSST